MRKEKNDMAKTMSNDSTALKELRDKISRTIEVSVPKNVLEDVCHYCESNAIYDKLAAYGDFYYKIKKLLGN